MHFRVVLAKSDVMLAMDIEKWMSYSEAVGIMGGIIEVVVVLVIAFMIKVEMFAEPRSPIRQSTRRMVRVLEVGIKTARGARSRSCAPTSCATCARSSTRSTRTSRAASTRTSCTKR